MVAIAPTAVFIEGDSVFDVEDNHPLILILGVEED